VDLRIGVDKSEDLTICNPRATIPRSCDGALLCVNDAAATCSRKVRSTVRRPIVHHDNLDLIGSCLVSLAGRVDAVEQQRKVEFFIERRYDK
jgi:hypothetical protein